MINLNRRDFLKVGCFASIAPVANIENIVEEDFPKSKQIELERLKKLWLSAKHKVVFIVSKDWKTTSRQFIGYHTVDVFISELHKQGYFPFAIIENQYTVRRLDILKTYDGVLNEKIREKNVISTVLFLDKNPTNFMLGKYLNNVFVL